MKTRFILFVATLLAAVSCSNENKPMALSSDTDSMAYVVGVNMAQNLLQVDSTINLRAVARGISDAAAQKALFTDEEARAYFLRYMNHLLPEKARRYEEEFLDEFARENHSYARTATGVTYAVAEIGDQELVPTTERDTVVVRMKIRTMDNTEVYSSYERQDTLRVALSDLVKGLQESLRLVGKGGKISSWLPSREAYGAEGNAELGIKPNAVLFYEVELLDVDKYMNRRR